MWFEFNPFSKYFKGNQMIRLFIFLALSSMCLNCGELSESDVLRESGKTLEALDGYNKEIVLGISEENYEGVFNSLIGRFISWQHLWNGNQDRLYAIFALKNAEALEDFSKNYRIFNKKHLILFLQGKAQYMLKNYTKAEIFYSKALSFYPAENAEKGDWIAHHGHMMMLSGDIENGKERILQGITTIKNHLDEIDLFQSNVYLSGAYLRLASSLKDTDLKEATKYLKFAEQIILQDNRLVIRKKQLDKLNGYF